MVKTQVLESDRPGFPVLALPLLNVVVMGNFLILSGFGFLICKNRGHIFRVSGIAAMLVCLGSHNKVPQTR